MKLLLDTHIFLWLIDSDQKKAIAFLGLGKVRSPENVFFEFVNSHHEWSSPPRMKIYFQASIPILAFPQLFQLDDRGI